MGERTRRVDVTAAQNRGGAAAAARRGLGRALGVSAATLPKWREALLASGEAALATRSYTFHERRHAGESGRYGPPALRFVRQRINSGHTHSPRKT
jgi:hypothetical protein